MHVCLFINIGILIVAYNHNWFITPHLQGKLSNQIASYHYVFTNLGPVGVYISSFTTINISPCKMQLLFLSLNDVIT